MEQIASLALKEAIVEYISQEFGAVTEQDIVRALGADELRVFMALNELRNDGLVDKIYCLTQAGETFAEPYDWQRPTMRPAPDQRFWRGLRNGLPLAVLCWAGIVLLAVAFAPVP